MSSGLCLISANKEFGIFNIFLDSFMDFTVTSRMTKCLNTHINARVGVGSQNCALTSLHQTGVAQMPGTRWPLMGQSVELHCKYRAQNICIFLMASNETSFQDGFLFSPNHPFPGDQEMTLGVRFIREIIQALRNQIKAAKGCPDPVSLPG